MKAIILPAALAVKCNNYDRTVGVLYPSKIAVKGKTHNDVMTAVYAIQDCKGLSQFDWTWGNVDPVSKMEIFWSHSDVQSLSWWIDLVNDIAQYNKDNKTDIAFHAVKKDLLNGDTLHIDIAMNKGMLSLEEIAKLYTTKFKEQLNAHNLGHMLKTRIERFEGDEFRAAIKYNNILIKNVKV